MTKPKIFCADCKNQIDSDVCVCGKDKFECSGDGGHVYRPSGCWCYGSTSYNYYVVHDEDIATNIVVSISDDGTILPVAETEWDVL